jgi:transposase-like protein
MQLMSDRKGATWQQAMDSLKEIGLNLKAAISDAGTGLLKGIKAAFPEADVQIDVFHILRDIGRAVYRFKEHILKDIAECYDMEVAVKRSKHPERESVKSKKEETCQTPSSACQHG